MNIRFHRVPRRPGWSRASVIVTCSWLAIVGAITLVGHVIHANFTLCPLRQLTGIPCAGCGTTRGVLAMLRGHPLTALAWNPLGCVLIWAFVLHTGLRLSAGVALRIGPLSWRAKMAGLACGVALLLANWAYVLHRLG